MHTSGVQIKHASEKNDLLRIQLSYILALEINEKTRNLEDVSGIQRIGF